MRNGETGGDSRPAALELEADIVHIADELPVLPLRDAVLFPYAILPLSVDRDASSLAVDSALSTDRAVLLLSQRDAQVSEPAEDDLYTVGCVGTIMRAVKLPDGSQRRSPITNLPPLY